MTASSRPTGVTILAILAIVFGVLGAIGSIFAFLGLGVIAAAGAQANLPPVGILTIFVILGLVLSILNIVFGIGALGLKPWAWKLGIGIQAFGIANNIIQQVLFSQMANIASTIVALVISGLILYYLFRPNVKRAFGQA